MKQFADPSESQRKLTIILLFSCILIAYTADMLLVPYYPQFFLEVYGVSNPHYVGLLIAFCRAVMMFAYPAWAKLSKSVPVLKILVFTQGLAGLSILACMLAPDEWSFLFFSMISVGFKSSYLLIYPLLVNWSGRDRQVQTVSLYGFMIHFATILAAVAGGILLDFSDPRYLLLIICITDWIQMAISWFLLKKNPAWEEEKDVSPTPEPTGVNKIPDFGIVWLIFLFYAALSLIRPYFTRFIESLSLGLNTTQLGILFVLPAVVAITVSVFYRKFKLANHIKFIVVIASLLVLISTWVQVAGQSLTEIIGGRIFYGLAIFLIQTGIDLAIFKNSKSGEMAWNYRLVTTSMNGALIAAPLSLGYIIEIGGLSGPFYVSIGVSLAFMLSATLIFYPLKISKLKILRKPITQNQ